MKKISWKFVVSEIVIAIGVSVAAGITIAVACNLKDVILGGIYLGFMILEAIVMAAIVSRDAIAGKIAKKTMNKLSGEEFYNGGTFYSPGGIIRIDMIVGRIAYVSNWNPFQVQIVSAKDISEIETYYAKGVLGGTRYVCFQFACRGRKFRFSTFSSRTTYELDSEKVREGMAVAEDYCERLRKAQKRALMDDVGGKKQ